VDCWGGDTQEQLGTAPVTCSGGNCQSTVPIASGVTDATSIAVGDTAACELATGGAVKCWGSGTAYGSLGNGTLKQTKTPVPVLTGATAVSAGGYNGCALLSGGTVQCWGSNLSGFLGDGMSPSAQTYSASPVAVTGLSGVTSLSVGAQNVCAIVSGGAVQCWGDNGGGQLGNGTHGTFSTSPMPVMGLTGATAVSVGFESACALLSNGIVECWGSPGGGILGSYTPTPVRL
jgi:alpha-tubulin suppressor-like RCC1 family protein